MGRATLRPSRGTGVNRSPGWVRSCWVSTRYLQKHSSASGSYWFCRLFDRCQLPQLTTVDCERSGWPGSDGASA